MTALVTLVKTQELARILLVVTTVPVQQVLLENSVKKVSLFTRF